MIASREVIKEKEFELEQYKELVICDPCPSENAVRRAKRVKWATYNYSEENPNDPDQIVKLRVQLEQVEHDGQWNTEWNIVLYRATKEKESEFALPFARDLTYHQKDLLSLSCLRTQSGKIRIAVDGRRVNISSGRKGIYGAVVCLKNDTMSAINLHVGTDVMNEPKMLNRIRTLFQVKTESNWTPAMNKNGNVQLNSRAKCLNRDIEFSCRQRTSGHANLEIYLLRGDGTYEEYCVADDEKLKNVLAAMSKEELEKTEVAVLPEAYWGGCENLYLFADGTYHYGEKMYDTEGRTISKAYKDVLSCCVISAWQYAIPEDMLVYSCPDDETGYAKYRRLTETGIAYSIYDEDGALIVDEVYDSALERVE